MDPAIQCRAASPDAGDAIHEPSHLHLTAFGALPKSQPGTYLTAANLVGMGAYSARSQLSEDNELWKKGVHTQ